MPATARIVGVDQQRAARKLAASDEPLAVVQPQELLLRTCRRPIGASSGGGARRAVRARSRSARYSIGGAARWRPSAVASRRSRQGCNGPRSMVRDTPPKQHAIQIHWAPVDASSCTRWLTAPGSADKRIAPHSAIRTPSAGVRCELSVGHIAGPANFALAERRGAPAGTPSHNASSRGFRDLQRQPASGRVLAVRSGLRTANPLSAVVSWVQNEAGRRRGSGAHAVLFHDSGWSMVPEVELVERDQTLPAVQVDAPDCSERDQRPHLARARRLDFLRPGRDQAARSGNSGRPRTRERNLP